jgi:RNA polymerase sigma-70 factor (ECF subfamily)
VNGHLQKKFERRSYLDISELNELVSLHGNAVYGFCHKLVKNRTDADDLYQETFLKAMELCYKIDKNNNPKGFLISIAVRLWKNNSRKFARRKRLAQIEELSEHTDSFMLKNKSTPEDIAISNELRNTIQTAADTLNDKLKLPLYMYYTAGMSNEEIAAALKIPQGTVKSRLYKARKALRNILEMEAEIYEKF